ncbi:MAG: hypothetical protein ABI384_05890 [Allobranchiibius sp.]
MRVVVTGVRSRTHLVHVSAYLRDALRTSDSLDVDYVGGGRFIGNATVSSDDVAKFLPDDARLSVRVLSSMQEWTPDGAELTYVAVGAPGIKPWTDLRRRQGRSRIRVVVTDEGIGSYGTWRTRHDAWTRQGLREPWCSVRTTAVRVADITLTSQRFAMYDKTRNWELDRRIAGEFRWRTSAGDEHGSGRAVLLTQPWVEMGSLPEDVYRAHIEAIHERTAALGLRLVIRPHPAEHIDRYDDFETLPGDRPAELDGRIVDSALILGGTSTALLNLAALHGLRCYRVQVPGLEHLEQRLGANQRALLERYLPALIPVADIPAG